MNQQTAALVRELAAQLGTTADRLVDLFVPRVVTGAIFHLIVWPVLVVLAVWLVRKAHRVEDDLDREIPIAGAWVLVLVVSITATFAIGEAVKTLASPQAASIVSILRALRGE